MSEAAFGDKLSIRHLDVWTASRILNQTALSKGVCVHLLPDPVHPRTKGLSLGLSLEKRAESCNPKDRNALCHFPPDSTSQSRESVDLSYFNQSIFLRIFMP